MCTVAAIPFRRTVKGVMSRQIHNRGTCTLLSSKLLTNQFIADLATPFEGKQI